MSYTLDKSIHISLNTEDTFTSKVEQWQRGQIIASVCTASQASHISYIPESLGGEQGSKIPPTVSKEQVWDQLMRLNMYKSKGPANMQSRVLKNDVVAKPLSVTCGKTWLFFKVTSNTPFLWFYD